jgi:hypothetical protein
MKWRATMKNKEKKKKRKKAAKLRKIVLLPCD